VVVPQGAEKERLLWGRKPCRAGRGMVVWSSLESSMHTMGATEGSLGRHGTSACSVPSAVSPCSRRPAPWELHIKEADGLCVV
jgi:hypothetical protein